MSTLGAAQESDIALGLAQQCVPAILKDRAVQHFQLMGFLEKYKTT